VLLLKFLQPTLYVFGPFYAFAGSHCSACGEPAGAR
jgi:hypothetical protein